MVKGSTELQVEEKRKGFSRFVVLGLRCTTWLFSMVEEVLGNPGIEDFVKSFREGSKATITRKGEHRSGRFLEVAVYAVGGRDGWGWSCVSGELSKAMAFVGVTDGSPSSSGPSVGFKLNKEIGLPSFAEVVHSAATVSVMGCGLWVRLQVHRVRQRL
jgi:hypothetical protein